MLKFKKIFNNGGKGRRDEKRLKEGMQIFT